MFSSFCSCCLNLFSSKDEIPKSSLSIKTPRFSKEPPKPIEIFRKKRNLSIFSQYLVEEVLSPNLVNLEDFYICQQIGKGAFGRVYLVENNKSQMRYAMKVITREDFECEKERNKAILEKNIMKYSEHPFIVKLRFSFQTPKKLYLIMDYVEGGTLMKHLRKSQRFDEETARFYAVEIILALEYLHQNLNIVYRDLKPENLLLDSEGHLRMSDFGLSKYRKNSYSFCGSPNYVAPEVLLMCGHVDPVDIWGFGCLLYEMIIGWMAFEGRSANEIFKKILEQEPLYPSFLSSEAKNLIELCLRKNPSARISLKDIKKHKFFKGTDWEGHLAKQIPPPTRIKQSLKDLEPDSDYKHFDRKVRSTEVVETDDEDNSL